MSLFKSFCFFDFDSIICGVLLVSVCYIRLPHALAINALRLPAPAATAQASTAQQWHVPAVTITVAPAEWWVGEALSFLRHSVLPLPSPTVCRVLSDERRSCVVGVCATGVGDEHGDGDGEEQGQERDVSHHGLGEARNRLGGLLSDVLSGVNSVMTAWSGSIIWPPSGINSLPRRPLSC